MSRISLRPILTAALIATLAPLSFAVLDLEQAAYAKNGNGNGGGNGGGHGGGNGGGHGNNGGNGGGNGNGNAGAHAKTADISADTDTVTGPKALKQHKLGLTDDPSLSPNALGKLNGVLNASPQAIAHASTTSPIGTARTFGEALSKFLGELESEEPTEGEETASEEETDTVTVEELGEMMANMTNKPVTAEQVQAVADKLGISPAPEHSQGEETAGEEATGEETGEQLSEDDEAPTLDQELAQEIADEANEIHGFTDPTDEADGDTEADDGTEETAEVVN